MIERRVRGCRLITILRTEGTLGCREVMMTMGRVTWGIWMSRRFDMVIGYEDAIALIIVTVVDIVFVCRVSV